VRFAVARELASHLRLKLRYSSMIGKIWASGEGTGFSSEIETLSTRLALLRLSRCGEGTGFSSEIETFNHGLGTTPDIVVARELASHLRLKPIWVTSWPFAEYVWRGNWLLI